MKKMYSQTKFSKADTKNIGFLASKTKGLNM